MQFSPLIIKTSQPRGACYLGLSCDVSQIWFWLYAEAENFDTQLLTRFYIWIPIRESIDLETYSCFTGFMILSDESWALSFLGETKFSIRGSFYHTSSKSYKLLSLVLGADDKTHHPSHMEVEKKIRTSNCGWCRTSIKKKNTTIP